MTTKEIQTKIDALSQMRQYWREMRGAASSHELKDILKVLKKRIDAKAKEYVEQYDKCDPENAIGIARAQEGRLLCKEILKEFDSQYCTERIDKLDKEIKILTEKRDTSNPTIINGYDVLER